MHLTYIIYIYMVSLDDVPSEGKSFLGICPDSSGFLESKTHTYCNCMHLHGVFEGQSIVTSTDIPRNHLIKGTTSNKKLHFSADFSPGSAACQTCMDGASCEPDSNGIYSNLGPSNKGRGIKGAQKLAFEIG